VSVLDLFFNLDIMRQAFGFLLQGLGVTLILCAAVVPAAALAGLGVTATLRRARGDDIFAACGQLGARADAHAAPPSPAHDFR